MNQPIFNPSEQPYAFQYLNTLIQEREEKIHFNIAYLQTLNEVTNKVFEQIVEFGKRVSNDLNRALELAAELNKGTEEKVLKEAPEVQNILRAISYDIVYDAVQNPEKKFQLATFRSLDTKRTGATADLIHSVSFECVHNMVADLNTHNPNITLEIAKAVMIKQVPADSGSESSQAPK